MNTVTDFKHILYINYHTLVFCIQSSYLLLSTTTSGLFTISTSTFLLLCKQYIPITSTIANNPLHLHKSSLPKPIFTISSPTLLLLLQTLTTTKIHPLLISPCTTVPDILPPARITPPPHYTRPLRSSH